jgi:hypothetical protein
MQRIDENTYIDDTLVTCAEYQLFIDEMREKGKYHQPDHWTSYQFSKGKAREPILGVLPSDAKFFCDWLTKRMSKDWHYRLPTYLEANEKLLNVSTELSAGYWTSDGDTYQFMWIGSAHIDDLAIELERLSDRTPAILKTFDNRIVDMTILEQIINRAKNLARVRPYAYDLDVNDNGYERYNHLVRDLALETKIQYVERSIFSTLSHAFDNSHQLISNPDLASVLVNISRIGDRGRALRNAKYIDRLLCSIVDLVREEERIAGRSPAFEGIRLVKERTR